METEQVKIKVIFLDIDNVLNSHKFSLQESESGRPYLPYLSELDPKELKGL